MHPSLQKGIARCLAGQILPTPFEFECRYFTVKPADQKSAFPGPPLRGVGAAHELPVVLSQSPIRIDGGTTNTHAVVESFNYLPPE